MILKDIARFLLKSKFKNGWSEQWDPQESDQKLRRKMSEGIWPMHNDKAIFNCIKGLGLWKKSYDQSWKIGVWSHHVFKNKNGENIKGET